ncbi:hypothetical protein M086_3832, partial [Bacteroides fragilis str. S13 L11]
YCYVNIKRFLLKKNFSNIFFVSKESITFVVDLQGDV